MISLKKSLKKKLILLFIITSVIPVIAALLFMYLQSVSRMNKMIDTTLTHSTEMIDYFLYQKSEEALKIAERYIQNEDFLEAFKNKDKEKLDALILPVYTNLNADYGITVFEFGDSAGIVFTRSQNPEKFGDSKADNASIKLALEGKSVKGLELGSSGLKIRAFVPIKDNDKVIGTFQVGFDDTVLDDIHMSIDGEVSLYVGNVLVRTSDEKDKAILNQPLSDESIFERVSQGESIRKTDENQNIILYYPLYDIAGEQVIGMIGVTQDISSINNFKHVTLLSSIVLIAIILVITTIISVFLVKNIIQPIQKVEGIIKQTSELNLVENSAEESLVKHKDEIGSIARSTADMRIVLKELVEKLICITKDLKQNSEEMVTSTDESTKTIHQVVNSINEIAVGNGNLAVTVNKTNQAIVEVLEGLEQVNEVTLVGAENAKGSLGIVEHGQIDIQLASEKMQQSSQYVSEVSDSFHVLSEIIGQVANITTTIDTIAEQTNLLSLNAAIEAARAGESGMGFAVVAEEIRKLAVSSSKAAEEITNMIKDTCIKNDIAIDMMEKTKGIVHEQEKAVHLTKEAFEKIRISVEDIVDRTNSSAMMISKLSIASKSISSQTEEMSAIAQESAASSEEILASSEEQLASIEMIEAAANSLSEMVIDLSNEIQKFHI